MRRLQYLCLLTFAVLPFVNSEPPVLILAENLQQVITSSTLEWVAVNSKQPKHFEDAVVGAYQIMQDEPDEENSAFNNMPGEPVYVCRAKLNGVWVSGQLRPNDPKCIVSLRGVVDQADRYEVLINIEKAARLSWVRRDKYTLDPQGAVTGGDEPFRTFIARRTANSHNKEGSLTYFLGKLDPTDNLGKYTVVDQNDEQLEYEDGEILVETEAVAYELSQIKLDDSRKRVNQNPVVLGHVILKNEFGYGEGYSDVVRVDAVISYRYNYSLYWGHGHGILTGLPLVVRLPNGSNLHGQWGIPESVEKVETHQIEGYLAPGTAVNVTLRGNYGEWDTPYSAVVYSLYKDGEKIDRDFKDNQRETSMRNVMPEFGPVYFLHNNSFVPTTTSTTTTTTTTRSTTTTKTTTTTTEDAAPLTPPEVLVIPANTEKRIPEEQHIGSIDAKHENNNMLSDDAQSLKNKDANEVKKDDGGNASSLSAISIAVLIAAVVCARKIT